MLSRYCKWGNEIPHRKRHSESLDKALTRNSNILVDSLN